MAIQGWTSVNESLPDKAERVLVFNGSFVPGRLMNNGTWLDDTSVPIRGVTDWTRVIAPGETVQ